MSTFAKQSFSAAKYATFRPLYPSSLYDTILRYHKGPTNLCLDLGTGHGLVARAFTPHFKSVIGTDPSPGMVKQAQSASPSSEYSNLTFREASAESLPFIEDGSVDLVVAAQAAHWFKFDNVWPEMQRILRPGATLAFWGYKDNVFIGFPYATELLHKASDPFSDDPETLGPYWEPGRKLVVRKLQDVTVPQDVFSNEQRIEYEPAAMAPESGEGTMFVRARMTVEAIKGYVRTFSSFNNWQSAHPDKLARDEGGPGDFVDELFAKAASREEIWNQPEKEIEMEWGSYLLMATRT